MKLEGCLTGPWVEELATCWRQAIQSKQTQGVRVDLRGVCHVDDAGRELMTRMYLDGARFVASGCVMPEVVREISEPAAVRHSVGERN